MTVEWVEDGTLGAWPMRPYGRANFYQQQQRPQQQHGYGELSPTQTRHWRIYVWPASAPHNPPGVSDVYMNQLQVQQYIRTVWKQESSFAGADGLKITASAYGAKVQALPVGAIPAGGAYGFETTDGQHVRVLTPATYSFGPVQSWTVHGVPEEKNMTVEWVTETKTLNGVEWVASGMLGDAYNDCMSSCVGACNDMHATDPGALQACIAACPTTCLLYQVKPGGTPNKPNACMTQCLADANSLSDPSARAAAIAACPTTCALQQAASCPAGTTKDSSGKCVPIGPSTGCATDSDCGADKECVQGLCVDKCPAGQVRDSSGNCGVPAAKTSSNAGTWGLALLAAGAAAAIFFGLRPPSMTAADKAHAQRYKENPRRRHRRAA